MLKCTRCGWEYKNVKYGFYEGPDRGKLRTLQPCKMCRSKANRLRYAARIRKEG